MSESGETTEGSGESIDTTTYFPTDFHPSTNSSPGDNGDTREWLYGGIGILLGIVATLLVIAIVYLCIRKNQRGNEKFAMADSENGKRYHANENKFLSESSLMQIHEANNSDKESASQMRSGSKKMESFDSKNESQDSNNIGQQAKTNEAYQKHDDDAVGDGDRYSITDIDGVVNDSNKSEDGCSDKDDNTTGADSVAFPDPPDEILENAYRDDATTISADRSSEILTAEASIDELDKIISYNTSDDGLSAQPTTKSVSSSQNDPTDVVMYPRLTDNLDELNGRIDSAHTQETDDTVKRVVSDKVPVVQENHSNLSDPEEVSLSDEDEESEDGEDKIQGQLSDRKDPESSAENSASDPSGSQSTDSIESVIDLTNGGGDG